MASDVLATLYVDVVARGVTQAASQIRGLTQNLNRGSGGGNAGGAAGGGGGVGGVAAMLGGIPKAAAAATAALAPVAIVVHQVKQGLTGTVEGEQLANQFLQISREVAAVFLPVVRGATAILSDLTQAFRAGGAGLQDLTLLIGPAWVGLRILFSPEIVSGARRLIQAFGQLNAALAPLFNLLVKAGGALVNFFIVDPVLLFVKALESALRITAALVNMFLTLTNALGRGLGLGELFDLNPANQPARRRVTLAQTGSESAEGTFARFQEAALKAGTTDPLQEQASYLKNIDTNVTVLVRFIEGVAAGADRMTDPGALARGAIGPEAAGVAAGAIDWGRGLVGGMRGVK